MSGSFTNTGTISNLTRLELEQLRQADFFSGGRALTRGDSGLGSENVVGIGNILAEPYSTGPLLTQQDINLITPPTQPGLFLDYSTQVGNPVPGTPAQSVTWFGPTKITFGTQGSPGSTTSFQDIGASFIVDGVLAGDLLLIKKNVSNTKNQYCVAVITARTATVLTLGAINNPTNINPAQLDTSAVSDHYYTVVRPSAIRLFAIPSTGPAGREQAFLFVSPSSTLHTVSNPSQSAIEADRIHNIVPPTFSVYAATDSTANRADSVYTAPNAPFQSLEKLGYRIILFPDNGSGQPDLTKPIDSFTPAIDSTINGGNDQRYTIDYRAGVVRLSVAPRAGDAFKPSGGGLGPAGRLNLYAVFWSFETAASSRSAEGLYKGLSTDSTVVAPAKVYSSAGVSNRWVFEPNIYAPTVSGSPASLATTALLSGSGQVGELLTLTNARVTLTGLALDTGAASTGALLVGKFSHTSFAGAPYSIGASQTVETVINKLVDDVNDPYRVHQVAVASFDITATDTTARVYTMVVDTTTPITVDLLLPDPTTNKGRTFRVLDKNSTVNTTNYIQLVRNGSETIDGVGGANKFLTDTNGRWTVYSDGVNWLVGVESDNAFDLTQTVDSTTLSVIAKHNVIVLVSATSAASTLNLPDPVANKGYRITIINVDGKTTPVRTITIARSASETIDTQASNVTFSDPFGRWDVVSDGTNWHIKNCNLFNKMQVFTASGNWSCPYGVNRAVFHLAGGGQGGGGGGGGDFTAVTTGNGGLGGNAGTYVSSLKTVTPLTSYAIVCGAGGTAGTGGSVGPTTNGTNGGNGGATTVTTLSLSAAGGTGAGSGGAGPGGTGTAATGGQDSDLYPTGGGSTGLGSVPGDGASGIAGTFSGGGGGGQGGGFAFPPDGQNGGGGGSGGVGAVIVFWTE